MNRPLVSIIIPNYNHEKFLVQRLKTVLNQSYENFEVILLDDASTDGSPKLLKNYKSHPKVSHLVINEDNSKSPFKQWQIGIAQAKGEYIWIAESDDFCQLHFLERLLAQMDKHTGIGYAQTIDVDENGKQLLNREEYTAEFSPNIWRSDFRMDGLKFIENYLIRKNVIPNASVVLFKKELVDNSIFSQPLLNMKMCGDWFFWVKLSEKTNVAFVAEPMNYFRHHAAISRTHTTAAKKRRRLLEEAEIRKYLLGKLNLYEASSNRRLLKKWFRLHPITAMFSASFYKMGHSIDDKFSLLLKFLRFKLKN